MYFARYSCPYFTLCTTCWRILLGLLIGTYRPADALILVPHRPHTTLLITHPSSLLSSRVRRAASQSLSESSFMNPTNTPTPQTGAPLRKVNSGGSTYSVSPLAQAAIARDLEEESYHDLENAVDESGEDQSSDSDDSTLRPDRTGRSYTRSMVGSYRRASYTAGGPRATVGSSLRSASRQATKSERHEARREERSLLRDNNVIPPKHPQREQGSRTLRHRISHVLPSVGVRIPGGDRKVVPPDDGAAERAADSNAGLPETAPLLGNPELPYGGQDSPRNLDQKWEDAVMEGKIKTTWQREAKVLARYSAPLIVTFLLQYSLTVASIFTVGHLGKVELGAVSLASMTANIFGYAIYQGLATSLDTLCAQAYGSGHKKLVGLQMQRMVYFLWAITVPIGIIWLSADRILERIVPEKDVARKKYPFRLNTAFVDQMFRSRWLVPQGYPIGCTWICLFRKRKAISPGPGLVFRFSLRSADLCSSECFHELALCLGNTPFVW